jgi:dTDP-4-dehydrorhamnose reductase
MKKIAKNKILITGANGLLGRGLLTLTKDSYELIPAIHVNKGSCGRSIVNLDITDKKDVFDKFKIIKPNIVIHTASIGNVDYCEKHQKEAYEVNVKGTLNIVKACEKFGAKHVFLSSNAVFDGLHAPYSENSKIQPVNYYGKTKAIAEELVEKSKADFTIVRLILMYGWNNLSSRQNPITWLMQKIKNKEKVKLVNDTYANPIYNLHAAKSIYKIIDLKKGGIFHLAGKDRVNKYEMGLVVAEVFGFDKKYIEPVSSDYFKGIARRMPDTTYNTEKMQKELKILPLSLKKGLELMKSANDR